MLSYFCDCLSAQYYLNCETFLSLGSSVVWNKPITFTVQHFFSATNLIWVSAQNFRVQKKDFCVQEKSLLSHVLLDEFLCSFSLLYLWKRLYSKYSRTYSDNKYDLFHLPFLMFIASIFASISLPLVLLSFMVSNVHALAMDWAFSSVTGASKNFASFLISLYKSCNMIINCNVSRLF